MRGRPPAQPTDHELLLLRILWDSGPLTPEEIQRALPENKGTAYSTVVTTLQRMRAKGLITRTRSGKSYRYECVSGPQATGRSLIKKLADSVFDGSIKAMVLSLIRSGELTPAELKELEELSSKEQQGRK